jgi:ATP-dependent DNA helicase HFM1/MER3
VLCTTSTLALGINLPAHLVVIKGTRRYCGGEHDATSEASTGYQEYDRSVCLQMVGRAGRPQFDTEGVAVIMTQKQVGPAAAEGLAKTPAWRAAKHTVAAPLH